MNDTCTVFSAYIVHACDDEGFLSLFRHAERFDLLVCPVLHVGALHLFDDFVFIISEHPAGKSLGDPEEVTLVFAGLHEAFDVVNIRPDGQSDVRGKSPRRGRPREEVLVVVIDSGASELACQGIYLDVLVPLCDLVRGKAGPAARAVRQDLVSLVYESPVEGGLYDPPSGLDVVVLERDVRVLHVGKISHLLRHVSPHLSVFEYGFAALFVEFLYSVFLDVLLSGKAQLLFDFDLYRKSVSIPASLALYLETLHGLVSVYRVLEGPCHHVVDARLAVRSRRSFIENKRRSSLSRFDAEAEQIHLIPLSYLFGLSLGYRLV